VAVYFRCPKRKGNPFLHIKVHEECQQENPGCEVYQRNLGHLPPLLALYCKLKAEDYPPPTAGGIGLPANLKG
jgi:hypothetical protein